jgi:hypothetical protein
VVDIRWISELGATGTLDTKAAMVRSAIRLPSFSASGVQVQGERIGIVAEFDGRWRSASHSSIVADADGARLRRRNKV